MQSRSIENYLLFLRNKVKIYINFIFSYKVDNLLIIFSLPSRNTNKIFINFITSLIIFVK